MNDIETMEAKMAKKGEYGFMEAVSDEELINLIENGVQNSVGDWLNSSDMAQERIEGYL